MHHSFDIHVASKYGVECALLIHHFQHWIFLNKRNNKNFHDGKTWTYQTIDEISAHFPYWGKDKVVNLLDLLCEGKTKNMKNKLFDPILCYSNYNKRKFDRTIWYAFLKEEDWVVTSKNDIADQQNVHIADQQKGDRLPATPIPDTKTHTKTDNKESIGEQAAPRPDSPSRASSSSSSKKVQRATHVATTPEEHESLIKDFGEAKTQQAYQRLSEWKEDTARSKWKKCDNRTIRRWVISAIEQKTSKDTSRSNIVESRHHGLQKDQSPNHPSRIKDFSNMGGR